MSELKKFNISSVAGLVKQYGQPLYELVQSHGMVSPGEYTIEGNSLKIENSYFPITQDRMDAGVDETQTFEIIERVALRDADGEFNGRPWSVAKGEIKVHAK